MNNVKAVIMAGGFGTRLKPLTDTMPKPLAPVLNEPALSHVLRHLFRHGVNDAYLTLKFMPDMIKDVYKDYFEGVSITYFTEDEPLGTAGGVKMCQEQLSDDIIVASGDGIWDMDISCAYEYHKSKNADVTILCAKTPFPSAYGVIMCDSDGRIIRFAEKPSQGEIFSDKVNTGIYIMKKKMLDFVPPNTPFDFSRDLFPLLMKNCFSLYAYSDDGAWCDIGSVEEYRRCNIEALKGKYSLSGSTPVYHNVYDSVIADGFTYGKNTSVCASVIHESVTLGDGVSVNESVICKGVRIENGARIPRGCIIGAGSVITEGITLEENTVIPTCTTVNGDSLMKNVIKKGTLFGSDGIKGDFYAGLSCDKVSILGGGVGTLAGTVGLVCDGSARSSAAGEIFAAGVKYGGGKCMCFKNGFLAMANYINMYYRFDITVYIKSLADGDGIHIIFRDKNGLKPKADFERKLENIFFSTEIPIPCDVYDTEYVNGGEELYKSALANQSEDALNGLDGYEIILGHSKECRLLSGVLSALGANVYEYTAPDSDDYIFIDIDEGSDTFRISEYTNGTVFTCDKYHAIATVISLDEPQALSPLALSHYDPPIYGKIASKRGIRTLYYLDSPSSELAEDNKARNAFYNGIFRCDPLALSIKLLWLLKKNNVRLHYAVGGTEQFFVREDTVSVPSHLRAHTLARLYEENLPIQKLYGDGVVLKNEKATSTVGMGDNGFRIITQGYSASAASDMVANVIELIKNG